MEAALQMCREASTGDQLACISQMLRCEGAVAEVALWSVFTAVVVSSLLAGDKPLSMLYLEGLYRTVDIVCYQREQILHVLDGWCWSCGCVSLYMHTSLTHMHVLHTTLMSIFIVLVVERCWCVSF